MPKTRPTTALEIQKVGDVTVVTLLLEQIDNEVDVELLITPYFHRLFEETPRPRLIINLGKARVVTVAFFALLMTINDRIERSGGDRLTLCNIHPEIGRYIFHGMLHLRFLIKDTLQEALAAVSPAPA